MSSIAIKATDPHSPASSAGEKRRYFHAPNGWWGPILFMLSMSAVGLSFYPAWLIVLAMLLKRFRTDRYEALIMLLIILAGSGFRDQPTTIECTLIYLVSIPLIFLLRKTATTVRILKVWAVYSVGCLGFAFLSLESIISQGMVLMWYLSFIFIMIPLGMFAGRSFSMDDFFNRLYPFAMIFMAFYWIDGLILCGPVMLSRLQPFVGVMKFYELYIIPFGGLSGYIARLYPAGFYIPMMLVYPVVRRYRLRIWELVLFLGALFITKTFALISVMLLGYIICQKGFGRVSKYIIVGTGLFLAIYGIDVAISDPADIVTAEGSKLRIASTVTQFVVLDDAQDVEDLSEFGTGRMAQIIPKVERLYELGLEWTGFGFLHPLKTENRMFMIENHLYSDIEQSYESVATVEVIPVQVFLNMGYLGLIWHILYLIALVLCVRKLPDAKYAWSLMVMFIWIGISGFCGMMSAQGQIVVATAFAVVILQEKTRLGINCKESPILVNRKSR